ncbi:putative P-loop containing nucleoside triphosphate hydrolase, leucine-rich repeat domain, L [Medicago truncatula]|uniref:Putative P-loop containing nucleoside triphosphate hydrolase, leucine-rich repeat domain, L n=1 Tax=Medicago truncatula TaxID=3880 RepID=A0A396JKE3_MEDTR|nr:putative P-loop containing nucleoside triphosphate hydrolase, leucine-rich repeat domain, L [Medicago truncatula]
MEGIVLETLLSTCVKVMLNKIVSSEFVDNYRRTKLDVSLLENLKTELLSFEVVVNDDAVSVNVWLNMLSDAVFHVDILFDEINTEALRCKVDAANETLTPTSQVMNNFSSHFERLNRMVINLIKELKGLSSGCVRVSNLDDESCIYGRENDMNKLNHLLLFSDFDDSQIRVISIVGMGGIGKTALAKLLYNDREVMEKFELKRFISKHHDDFRVFSKHYDDFRVLETILESVTSQTVNSDNLNTVYPNFLLVLDDVLDARSVNWTLLMDILNAMKTGSMIIITTRDERVPKSMQTFFYVHYLRPLESEDCWSLVARHAFRTCNNQQRSNLEEVGRKMAIKCYGLPLAAVALADFLCIKLSQPDYLNNFLIHKIWELVHYDILPALQLSYCYLLDPLKRCFEYCSIFPKKSILEKNAVVQLWIAEGLVESSADQEKVGEEYFDELVSRSLIHRRSIGNEEANFEMHSLLHDLATMVSSSYCTWLDGQNLHARIDNLSYNRGPYDSFKKFDKLYRVKGLRTFLAFPLQKQRPFCLLSNKVVNDLLPTMKQLRALSLSNYKSIIKVPKSIGKLFFLRYLNVSHTKIGRLPSETCKLYNLQFLAGCTRLIELPDHIGELVNLCCLEISDTALRGMPIQISKLENLHTLSNFVVSKRNDGLNFAELGKFTHLHGKLSISQLQNVTDPSEAFQANLKMKERIDKLALEWDCGSTFSDSQVQRVVLENLRPSTNLKSLIIKGYGGFSIPNWLGDFLFGNMVYLRISNCDKCIWLPSLGKLGNLKELIIDSMLSIKSVGTEFYGSDNPPSFQPFPSLETLHFEDMPEWEEWNMIGGTTTNFPSLKSLLLSKCPKLRGDIPDKLPSLTELELRGYPLLVESRHSDDNSNFITIIPFSHVISQLMLPLYSLLQLTIYDFPFLTSFPTDGLPKTLKFLKIITHCSRN